MSTVADAAPGLRRLEHVMGMPIYVDVRDEVEGALLDRLFGWLAHVDATFSTYKPDSEISRIGRGELLVDDASGEVRTVLERCRALAVRPRASSTPPPAACSTRRASSRAGR